MVVGRLFFPIGKVTFQGRTVKLREGIQDLLLDKRQIFLEPSLHGWRTIPKKAWNHWVLLLVGGWTNPTEKHESNWIIFPGIRVKIKHIWNHQLDWVYVGCGPRYANGKWRFKFSESPNLQGVPRANRYKWSYKGPLAENKFQVNWSDFIPTSGSLQVEEINSIPFITGFWGPPCKHFLAN